MSHGHTAEHRPAPAASLSARVAPPTGTLSSEGMVWLAGVLLALAWTYWATLVNLYSEWQVNEDYSVGELVPLVALYVAWQDRAALRKCRIAPCWWGVGVILAAQAVRLAGLIYLYESAERYGLYLTVVGLVLLLAGWQVSYRLRWLLLFLLLAIPLPGRIHNMIAGPLQDYATFGAVFLLELCGISVTREGHVIVLDNRVQVAVAEACSGLRMMTAFVVVAAALAFLIRRPAWQRVVLVLSSVPVAILCNLARLMVTAELHMVASDVTARRFFHDFAGVTMMPLAVLFLMGELWVMKKLVVVEDGKK